MEITTHQRLIDSGPQLKRPDGRPVIPDCGGVMRVQDGDRGRGPIFTECDACGHVHGMARRSTETPQLALVGAGAGDDGYAKF